MLPDGSMTCSKHGKQKTAVEVREIDLWCGGQQPGCVVFRRYKRRTEPGPSTCNHCNQVREITEERQATRWICPDCVGEWGLAT